MHIIGVIIATGLLPIKLTSQTFFFDFRIIKHFFFTEINHNLLFHYFQVSILIKFASMNAIPISKHFYTILTMKKKYDLATENVYFTF